MRQEPADRATRMALAIVAYHGLVRTGTRASARPRQDLT